MKPDQIRVFANGEERWVPTPCTIANFLGTCGWKVTQVVVEHNGKVLARAELATVQLAEGDRMEIIVPVAGG